MGILTLLFIHTMQRDSAAGSPGALMKSVFTIGDDWPIDQRDKSTDRRMAIIL